MLTPEEYQEVEQIAERLKAAGNWDDQADQLFNQVRERQARSQQQQQQLSGLVERSEADRIASLTPRPLDMGALPNLQSVVSAPQPQPTQAERGRAATERGVRSGQSQALQAEYLGTAMGEMNPVSAGPVAGLLRTGTSIRSTASRLMGDRERADEIQDFGNIREEYSDLSWVNQQVAGTVDSLTTMFAAAPAGLPGVISAFTAKAADQADYQGRAAGLTGAKLGAYVAAQASAEGLITAAFSLAGLGGVEGVVTAPIKNSLKQGILQGLRTAGKTALAELPEEILIDLAQRTNDYLYGVDPDAFDPETMASDMAALVTQTVMTVGAASGIRAGASRLQRARQDNQLVPAELDESTPAPGSLQEASALLNDTARDDAVAAEAVRQTMAEPTQQQVQEDLVPAELDEAPAGPVATLTPEQVVEQMTTVSPKEIAGDEAEIEAEREYFKGVLENTKRPNDPFVLVDVPIDDLAMLNVPNPKTVLKYAKQTTEAPPGVAAIIPGKRKGKLVILDGKHRTDAARKRGATTVPMYVPEGDVAELGLAARQAAEPTLTAELDEAPSPVAAPALPPAPAPQVSVPKSAPKAVAKPAAVQNLQTQTASGVAALATPVQSRTMKKLREAVDRLIPEAARDVAGEWLGERGTFKRPSRFIEGRRGAVATDRATSVQAGKIAERLTKALVDSGMADATNREVWIKIMRTYQGKEAMDQWPAEVQDSIREMRSIQDAISEKAAEVFEAAGLKDRAEVYRGNVGEYAKSIPEWTLTTKGRVGKALRNFSRTLQLSAAFGKVRRIDWTVVNARGQFVERFKTEDEAKAFVEAEEKGNLRVLPPRTDAEREAEDVMDLRYVFVSGVTETMHDLQMVQLHQDVADNWGQKPPKGLKGPELTEWAQANDLIAMPHGVEDETGKRPRLHALKNVYIPRRIALDLSEMTETATGLQAVIDGYMRVWKKGVIVYNPASHGRNWLGNTLVFGTVGRISPANPANWKFYAAAIDDIATRSPEYIEAVKNDSGVGSDFASAEILKDLRANLALPEDQTPGGMLAWMENLDKRVVGAYQVGDSVFKMAAYRKYKSEGMTPKEAATEVNKWFPNYDRTSKLAQAASKNPLGAPFASFFDQSLRIAGRAAKERPIAAITLMALPGILDFISRMMLGAPEEELVLLRSNQGFLEGYFTPLLPWRDSKGKLLTFDLRYVYPLVNDILPDVADHGAVRIPWALSGPMATTLIEQMSGRSQFTGKQFDGAGDRFWAFVMAAAPLPSIVKHTPNRVKKSLTGDEETREDIAYAIVGSVTGLNARRPYVAEKAVAREAALAWSQGDNNLALGIMRMWNDQYRPSYIPKLTIRRIKSAAAKANEE